MNLDAEVIILARIAMLVVLSFGALCANGAAQAPVANQAAAGVYDHFFLLRVDKDNRDSLILVKAAPAGFEERTVYTEESGGHSPYQLSYGWQPLVASGGKFYAICTASSVFLCIDLANG